MTKADRIRQLGKLGFFSTREIADKVAEEFGSCTVTYARVVARQRLDGMGNIQTRYRAKPEIKKARAARQRSYIARKREAAHA